uniref:Uncharacterized protein n=1 Tax=Heterorhabditis bacteriophora TaxID=37862 RepID=A0A1I7XBR5_HETBA
MYHRFECSKMRAICDVNTPKPNSETYKQDPRGRTKHQLSTTRRAVIMPQRNPEDAPNGIVHAHYERLDVNEMVNISYAVFRELLEKAEKEQRKLERKIEASQYKEEEESQTIKKMLYGMQETLETLRRRAQEDNLPTISILEKLRNTNEKLIQIKESVTQLRSISTI